MKKPWIALAILLAILGIAAGCSEQNGTGFDDVKTKSEGNRLSENQDDLQQTNGKDTVSNESKTDVRQELVELAQEGFETRINCKPFTISLACTGDVDQTARGNAIRAAIEAAAEWTDGNFEIKFYPGGQLGGDAEILEGVQTGTLDMYTGSPTTAANLIPELSVLDIAGLYSSIDVANHVYEKYKDVLQPYCKQEGLELMALYAPDFRILTSSRPINTTADLSGLKIRTYENSYHMEFWRQLGATPVPMMFGKIYLSLSRGDLDAQENSWDVIAGSNFAEVQGYAVETNHLPFVTIFFMNQQRYESLDEMQKLVCRQFVEFCRRYQMEAVNDDDKRLAARCEEEYGMQISGVSHEIQSAYDQASEAVIEKMKQELDTAFVNQYVSMAREVSAQ